MERVPVIPDSLVTVAVEAMQRQFAAGEMYGMEAAARAALAAAFAALPYCADAGPDWGDEQADGWQRCLAALARMGEP